MGTFLFYNLTGRCLPSNMDNRSSSAWHIREKYRRTGSRGFEHKGSVLYYATSAVCWEFLNFRRTCSLACHLVVRTPLLRTFRSLLRTHYVCRRSISAEKIQRPLSGMGEQNPSFFPENHILHQIRNAIFVAESTTTGIHNVVDVTCKLRIA